MRERSQEMLVRANAEVETVLGEREGGRGRKQERVVLVGGKNCYGGAQRDWF